MKVANKKVMLFREVAELFLRNSGKEKTRLFFAVNKILKKTEGVATDYTIAQSDAREGLASVDKETKVLLIVSDKYQFTPENKKKLNTLLADLAKKEVDVEPHIIKKEDVPPKLSFTYKDQFGRDQYVSEYDVQNAFENFVLPEIEEEECVSEVVKEETVEA